MFIKIVIDSFLLKMQFSMNEKKTDFVLKFAFL